MIWASASLSFSSYKPQSCHRSIYINLWFCCQKPCGSSQIALLQVAGEKTCLTLPRTEREGVLWIESECAGILSSSLPLVLTGNADVGEEIAGIWRLENCQHMPEEEVRSILVDIGMALQYASHLEPGSQSLGTSSASPPMPPPPLPFTYFTLRVRHCG